VAGLAKIPPQASLAPPQATLTPPPTGSPQAALENPWPLPSAASVQAPPPIGPASGGPLRSLAPPWAPLERSGPALRDPLSSAASSASVQQWPRGPPYSAGWRACCGAAAWRLYNVFFPLCSSDPRPEWETTPNETRPLRTEGPLGNFSPSLNESLSPYSRD
jgi:hypothetical protein